MSETAFGLEKQAFALLCELKLDEAIEVIRKILTHDLTPVSFAGWEAGLHDVTMIKALLPNLPQPDQLKWGVSCDWDQRVAKQLPRSDGRLAVVFFHVDMTDKHPFLEAPVDYRAALNTTAKAAKSASPGARVIVVTNDATSFPNAPSWLEIVRLPVASSQMMYDRMRANRAIAAAGKIRGPVVFIDTDVVLNRDFKAVLDGSVDIGLTYRPDLGLWHMPINEAMILASKCDSEKTVQHFDTTLALYDWLRDQPSVQQRYEFDVRRWRGGQLSLASLVRWQCPAAGIVDMSFGTLRYRLLPCDDYNYAVQDRDPIPTLKSKWAVHFKGAAAKQAIAQYAAHK